MVMFEIQWFELTAPFLLFKMGFLSCCFFAGEEPFVQQYQVRCCCQRPSSQPAWPSKKNGSAPVAENHTIADVCVALKTILTISGGDDYGTVKEGGKRGESGWCCGHAQTDSAANNSSYTETQLHFTHDSEYAV